jgi:hypothetical protein
VEDLKSGVSGPLATARTAVKAWLAAACACRAAPLASEFAIYHRVIHFGDDSTIDAKEPQLVGLMVRLLVARLNDQAYQQLCRAAQSSNVLRPEGESLAPMPACILVQHCRAEEELAYQMVLEAGQSIDVSILPVPATEAAQAWLRWIGVILRKVVWTDHRIFCIAYCGRGKSRITNTPPFSLTIESPSTGLCALVLSWPDEIDAKIRDQP